MRPGPSRWRGRAGRASLAAVVLVAISVVAACSPTVEDTKSATYGLPDRVQQLTAHHWMLDRSDSTLTSDETGSVTLAFDATGTLSGQAPCNAYRGSFDVDGHELTITDISQTNRSCEPAIMQAERDYLTALGGRHTIDATDRDRLVLTNDAGHLSYDAYDVAAAMIGDWHVVSVARANTIETVVAGTDPVLRISVDGSVDLDTGCNPLRSTLDRRDDEVTFTSPAQTMRACDQPDGVMEQEAALAAALVATRNVVVSAGTITLLDGNGSIALLADRAP
jgi:heat shock protein HslJ